MSSSMYDQIRRYGYQRFPDSFPPCYACNGWGKTTVSEKEKCAECNCDGYIREFCQKIVACPICKGTGYKDAGQGQLL